MEVLAGESDQNSIKNYLIKIYGEYNALLTRKLGTQIVDKYPNLILFI